MSTDCLESIPIDVRQIYPDLVRFAQIYQHIRKGPDDLWVYYIDHVLSSGGKLVGMDQPLRVLMKKTIRNLTLDDKHHIAIWCALQSVLLVDYKISLSDSIGQKLFTYIGRYAYQILKTKAKNKNLLTKADVLESIDQSLFINIFTGWVFLSTSQVGINRDMWTRLIKNVLWDFARGRTGDYTLTEFLKNSPYFWVKGGNYKEWSRRSPHDKIDALTGIYIGRYRDPYAFTNGSNTLRELLEYHPDTEDIYKSMKQTETYISEYLKRANPTYTRT